jgi:hypothetical protein
MNKILGNRKPKGQKRTLKNLRVKDTVSHNLLDYTIVGLMKYEDSGYKWISYRLEGQGERIWLTVEQNENSETTIFRPIKMHIGNRPPNRLNYDNRTFYLEEAGTATIAGVEGEAGISPEQRVKYWKYTDEGEYYLSIELWGNKLEVFYGYTIPHWELNIKADK